MMLVWCVDSSAVGGSCPHQVSRILDREVVPSGWTMFSVLAMNRRSQNADTLGLEITTVDI